MKITKLKLGGIGRFHDDLEIPIGDLNGAPLVAIVGENGAGKTTTLECIPAALYRTMPSRGLLSAMANRKSSFVELGVDLGTGLGCEPSTARVAINGTAKQKKVEAYLFNADGVPLTSGKVSDYVSCVAKWFPEQNVFLSAAFAAQSGEGRFLDLPPAKRKELFAKLLGLGRLEQLAATAGDKVRAAQMERVAIQAKAEELGARARRASELRGDLEQTRTQLAELAEQREQADREAEVAREALERWRNEATRLDRALHEAEKRHQQACHVRDQAAGEIARQEARLGQVAIERARLGKQLGQRAELQRTINEADPDARLAELEAELGAIRDEEAAFHQAVADWRERLAEARAQLEYDKRSLAQCERDADRLENADVPCGAQGDFVRCPFIRDAVHGRDALEETRAALIKGSSLVSDLEGAQPPPLDPQHRKAIEAEMEACRRAQARIARAQAQLEAIEDAELRAAELDDEAARLRDEITAGKATLAALGDGVAEAELVTRRARAVVNEHAAARPEAASTRRLDELRREESDLRVAVGRLESSTEQAEDAERELVAVRDSLDATNADLDDWRHLQEALGKGGVQALEIDAAGPEVSDLTNELLHACYGSRFSVSLETTKLKADGKGTMEVFELRVIDTEQGTEGSADLLSGGEKVLISEALALAIAIYNARRSDVPMLDLFRDECAGALSHANAARYVEMLRRAISLGSFHRCYFVAHQPHLWDLADARLVFEDGAVRLEQ